MTCIKKARVVTMDAEHRVLEEGDVWIEDDIIMHMGSLDSIPDREIDGRGKVLIPGLIQPHIHLCQTLFRGLADDLLLQDWLSERIWPLENAHDAESLYLSAWMGIMELLASGTTTILDMETVSHTDAAFHALSESGIRAFAGKCLMDIRGGPLGEETDAALQETERLIHRWHGAEGGRIQYALAPRFIPSCSDAMWDGVRRLSEQHGCLVHTHGAENWVEVQMIAEAHQRSAAEYFRDKGLLNERLVVAHGVRLSTADQILFAQNGARLVHCPSSNLKLGSGIAPICDWRRNGITWGIGADGAACNNRLDGFYEMRLAALLQKPAEGPDAAPAEWVFEHATMGGARVLGMADRIGSLEVGKRADLVLLSWDGAHHLPKGTNVYSQLVYQTSASDVVLTMVDGKIIYELGEFPAIPHRSAFYQRAERAFTRLLHRAGISIGDHVSK